jgi:pimeloyl-ACP methyl ester carboxylesterase
MPALAKGDEMPDRIKPSRWIHWLAVAGALGSLVLLAHGCAAVRSNPVHFSSQESFSSEHLGPCSPAAGHPVRLDGSRPTTILVHGCRSVPGQFAALARTLERRGQQVICFFYDDRDRLETSSRQLAEAIEVLGEHLDHTAITILGHSLGGLVAYHALTNPNTPQRPGLGGLEVNLVTVAAPLNGVAAAGPCGEHGLHIASLGLTAAICRLASGAGWNEIHPKADPIQHPGRLAPQVLTHLQVITDERCGASRQARVGSEASGDFAFELSEQHNPQITADPRWRARRLCSGHSEVIGSLASPPQRLLAAIAPVLLAASDTSAPLPTRPEAARSQIVFQPNAE